VNGLMFRDETEAIAEQACKRSFENLQGITEALEQVKQRMKSNVNFENALELLLLYMKEV